MLPPDLVLEVFPGVVTSFSKSSPNIPRPPAFLLVPRCLFELEVELELDDGVKEEMLAGADDGGTIDFIYLLFVTLLFVLLVEQEDLSILLFTLFFILEIGVGGTCTEVLVVGDDN